MKRAVEKQLAKLLCWMEERQRVYLRRARGQPPPWTKDPLLACYKWTNVYREQDKQTVWLRSFWREPYASHQNLWFACGLFRQINWYPTCIDIEFPVEWDPRRVLSVMQRRAKMGLQNYSGAYLIKPFRIGHGSKPASTVWDVLNPLWKAYQKHPVDWKSMTRETAHAWLMGFAGFGSFIAAEVIEDLRWTRYLCHSPDINTWENPGPGARRGLNRIFGRPPRQSLPMQRALEEMRFVREWLLTRRFVTLLPFIEMRTVETCLCEFSKLGRIEDALKAGARVHMDLYRYDGGTLL